MVREFTVSEDHMGSEFTVSEDHMGSEFTAPAFTAAEHTVSGYHMMV